VCKISEQALPSQNIQSLPIGNGLMHMQLGKNGHHTLIIRGMLFREYWAAEFSKEYLILVLP
jgi:hypothetical protein